jgi:rsbT co-antagonist protein RsbR
MAKDIKERAAFSRSKIGGEVPMIVSEVVDGCLYSAFYGSLDSARTQAIIEKILDMLVQTESPFLIADLGNIDIVDSAIAARFIQLADAAKAVGSEVVFCGISPVIAQTMVGAGVNVRQLQIARNLKSALKRVFVLQGKDLTVLGEISTGIGAGKK